MGLINKIAPKDLKYTKTHEWVRMDGNGVATQGISDYAQQELKAVVYVDLPSIGQTVQKGKKNTKKKPYTDLSNQI